MVHHLHEQLVALKVKNGLLMSELEVGGWLA